MFLINGRIDDKLPVQDRGLHYGDGVFETIAVSRQTPLCWDSHYQRLKTGCDRLGIDCPSFTLLQAEAGQLVKNTDRGVLKIIITRGQGGRGYRSPVPAVPVTRILGLYPWPDFPEENYKEGVKVRICHTRLGLNPQLAGIKHLNRLEQVLARGEWDRPDIAEGLMLDTEGQVIEGTMSNLFIIRDQMLLTPDLSQCGIDGIVRKHVLDLAPEMGLPVEITALDKTGIYAADEIFLCNSIIGIWAVTSLETQGFTHGPWTRKIRDKLIERQIIIR